MPKPVKKTRTSKKKDVNEIAFDLVQQTAALSGEVTSPPFAAQLSAYMADLGRKGGRESGAKRMQNLSAKKRKDIASKAARARWAKRKSPVQS